MICDQCKSRDHEGCPEVARQADPDISDLDKIASEWCYCAHFTGPSTRPDRKPDPRRGA
jgi:hypothetical protein